MKNQYYNDIVEMLLKSESDGMRLGAIARNIYNKDCDLFDSDAEGKFMRIYRSVKRFLWYQRRLKRSPFSRNRWGYYGLKRSFAQQLELCFDDWEEEGIVLPEPAPVEQPKPELPQMLDLVADFFQ